MAKHKEVKSSESKSVEAAKTPFVSKVKIVTFGDILGIVQKEYMDDGSGSIVRKVFERIYSENEVITTQERKGEVYFICKI